MDVGQIASGLGGSASLGQGVSLGVLNSVLSLDQNLAARLAASIGLGTRIDAYA